MSAELDFTVTGAPDAPVLVLGASLGTTRQMWAPQLDVLSAHFRVVAFDHRGHGGSAVPAGPYSIGELGGDVLALLDRLEVIRFSYAGLSLGGMVGMWLAAEVPDRLERLALLCTSARLETADGYRDRAGLVRREGIATVADAVLGRWFTPRFHALSPDTVARYRAMLVSTPAEGYAGCCEAIAGMDLRGRLAEIAAPTLVVAAERDEALPVADAELIAARVPGARLAVVADAAHLANVEQPAAVTGLLAAHLGEE